MTDTIDQTAIADDELPADDAASGIVIALGDLGRGAVIQERGMCRLFSRSTTSIRRAVKRGELPPPVRLFGQCSWTVGVLIDYLEKRQRTAHADDEGPAHGDLDEDLRARELRLRP